MAKCKICGTRIEEGVAVCPSCGAKVISSAGVATGASTVTGTTKPRVSSTTQVIKTTCPACGAEVVGEHRFCPQCGVNLKEAAEEKKAAAQSQERRCPSCGSVIQENARFCPDCGVSLAALATSAVSPATDKQEEELTPSGQSEPSVQVIPPEPTETTEQTDDSQQTETSEQTESTEQPQTYEQPEASVAESLVNTRNLRISLIPESLTETTAYFDTVQDACASSVMSDKGGMWTIAVEGDLTEDELDSIVGLVARTDGVKCLDFSSCTNALSLKTDYFFNEDVFGQCKGLETVKLADSSIKTRPNVARQEKKKSRKGIIVAVACVAVLAVVAVVFPKKSDFVLVESDSSISSFYMCRHEVTQEEYQAIMGTNPSYFKGTKRPVEQVSWYDAVAYCNKLSRAKGLTPCYSGSEASGYSCNFNANGYRLPTEAEWEYAAREGKYHSSYTYSGSNDIASVAWYWDNSGMSTHDVMTKAPNRLGLYDMSGNVKEWCWDIGNVSFNRVSLGGGYMFLAEAVSHRDATNYSKHGDMDLGFRVVRTAQ